MMFFSKDPLGVSENGGPGEKKNIGESTYVTTYGKNPNFKKII